MDLLFFSLGGALLAALVHWWRPEVSYRAAAGFLLLTAAFFAVPLATPALQVPTDIAYVGRPWAETVPAISGRVKPANPLLSDIPFAILPLRTLARERWLRFEAPLWTHELGTGQPLLGSAQSAPFAPLHLLALPLPPLRALTVAVAWQVLLALLLTYALVLALGGGRTGAAFAAFAFAFSSYSISWAYYPIGMTAAWLPGVFLGLVLLRRGGRGGFSGLVACGAGLALSGHPETLAHTALAGAAVAGALVLSREGGPRRRFVLRLAAAAVLTGCLAAPFLLPVLEAVAESERRAVVEQAPMTVQPPPFEPRFLVLLADPLLFGSPRDGDWRGPGNFNELCSLYAGLLALALAAAGAVALRGRIALVLAGGLAALLAAMRVPPFFNLVLALPGLGSAAHARLRLFWVLAVAVAAGLGLEALLRDSRRRAIAAAAIAAAGVALALAPPSSASLGSPAVWQRAWWIAALAGAAVSFLVLSVPRLRPSFPWIAAGCLCLDLVLLGVRYNPVLPARLDLAVPRIFTPVLADFRDGAPFRVIADGRDLAPNLAALHGLWDPRGYDPMRPARAAQVVGRSFQPGFRVGGSISLRPGHRRPQAILNYLGVRYLLARHRRQLPSPWEPAWDGEGGRIWKNPEALPLFFLPAGVQTVEGAEPVAWRTVANPDFAALAVVEARPGESAATVFQEGRVWLRRVRPNGFDLEVESRTGGIAVSSVSYAPGWRARLDGSRGGEVRQVNSGFLGFEIPPGRHRMRLDYRPRSWVLGLWLAGTAIVGLAGATLFRLGRRWRGA